MKFKILILFALFSITVCQAQKCEEKFMLCDHSVNEISIREINKMIADDCLKLKIIDSACNEWKIIAFNFSLARRKNNENSYYERVIGNTLSKEVMQICHIGDIITISFVDCIEPNGIKRTLPGLVFTVSK